MTDRPTDTSWASLANWDGFLRGERMPTPDQISRRYQELTAPPDRPPDRWEREEGYYDRQERRRSTLWGLCGLLLAVLAVWLVLWGVWELVTG